MFFNLFLLNDSRSITHNQIISYFQDSGPYLDQGNKNGVENMVNSKWVLKRGKYPLFGGVAL